MKHKPVVVAIDGPAGAGKSTIAKIVARELRFLYVDTGAMYRAITWKALDQKVSLRKGKLLTELARNTVIRFKPDNKRNMLHVYVDGEDVTAKIRSENVSKNTSAVASCAGVRKVLNDWQRALGKKRSIVMEGRDIGTEIFPNARYKFYLDASPHERALRRFREQTAKGKRVNLDRIAHAIAQRDYRDHNRKVSPLRQAKDAIVIDSTHLSLEEAAQRMLQHIMSEQSKN